MITGDKQGIEIWNKLGGSTDKIIGEYFDSVRKAAAKHKEAYFSDLSEQIKKPLNNQKLYNIRFIFEKQQWDISLFMESK